MTDSQPFSRLAGPQTDEHTFDSLASPQNAGERATEALTPARWQRREAQPYQPGNLESVRHGARSDRIVEAKVAELRAALYEVAPDLDQPRFTETIERYLRAVAREKLLHGYLIEKGPANVGQRLWEAASAAANTAQKMSAELGLTPTGFHKLKALWGLGVRAEAEVAALEDLAARGAAIRASRSDLIEAEAVEELEP